MSYLKEVLKGNYNNYNEDRLSQIFSASFNHSNLFKKIFFKSINQKSLNLKELYSKTQINYGAYDKEARIDIIILRKRTPVILIENKVEAPLEHNQLKKYDQIDELRRCKKIAMVKNYFQDITQALNWKIHHWSDFYSSLKKCLNRGIKNPNDNFIILNFIEHLELMNMARVNKIARKNLEDLAIVLNKMKMDIKPHTSLSNKNFFETGNQTLSILEEIIDLAHQETSIVRRVGKNFRAIPFLSWWSGDDPQQVIGLSITVDVNARKSVNKIKVIGTGIFFYNKYPKRYEITTYCQYKKYGDFEKEIYYEKKDLVFDIYAKQVITAWKKWLQ